MSEGTKAPEASDSVPGVSYDEGILVLQDHAQEAALHDQPPVIAVTDKATIHELFHEATYF